MLQSWVTGKGLCTRKRIWSFMNTNTHTRVGTWSFLLVLTVSIAREMAPNNKQATSLTTLL